MNDTVVDVKRQAQTEGHCSWRWTRELIAPALYLTVTLAFTWPLPARLFSSVIGPFVGDNLEYVWKIWWVRHALFELRASPWLVPHVHWPHGYLLAYGEITPLHTVLMLPVTLLIGEVATYNLAVLLSTWLSAWFTYLWLQDITGGRKWAASVGGLIFAFCPYRMARIAGHLPLMSTEGIPLVLWGLERFWTQRRWRGGLLIGLGVSLSALSSWYYGLALAILVPVYWLARARPWRDWLAGRWFWVGVGVAGVIVVTSVAPFLLPYAQVAASGRMRIPLQEADFWSASLIDYALPNWRHPLWGVQVRRALTGQEGLLPYEFLLSPGYVVGLLALLGLRQKTDPARRAIVAWVAAALVLSLGPTLHLLPGWPLRIPLPPAIAEWLTGALTWVGSHSLASERFTLNAGFSGGTSVLPMPALLVRWFVVGGAGMRSWGRFSVFSMAGLAALAALALGANPRTSAGASPLPRYRKLAVFVLGILVLFEFYTGPQSMVCVEPRPVDEWLAQQPGDFAIVQMPLKVALSGPQMLYTRYHGKNIIGGYGTYLPLLFEEQYPELAEFPSAASLDRLEAWPVRFVLVDREDLADHPGLADAMSREPRLSRATTEGTVDVYEIVPGG
jgi:hypothetical protein